MAQKEHAHSHQLTSSPRRQAFFIILTSFGGIVLCIAIVLAGWLLYQRSHPVGQGESIQYTSPAQLHKIAQKAAFPVLLPSWLPPNVALQTASGNAEGSYYDVTLGYATLQDSGGNVVPLQYTLDETNNPTINLGYAFTDAQGHSYEAKDTPHPVQVGKKSATLHEYAYYWHGKLVVHALALVLVQGSVWYTLSAEDVAPEASAAGSKDTLQILTSLPAASAADLIHMVTSFQTV